MATNNDPNEYLEDEDETGGLPDEGDLRFAGDSIPGSDPAARDDQSGESDGVTWMPSPRLEPDPAPEAPADAEDDTPKTWVPSETPTVNALGDDESSASLASVDDTWVPDDQRRKQSSEAGEAAPSEEADDPNKTWVPSSTPTADGMNVPAEEADDPNKTWVPSSTPTADGMDGPAEEADDPNKTWVPSSTPTADGMNGPAEEADDPNKTWVPSSTPTADGMNVPAAEADDPNKTWVPEDTPTHHDFSFDKAAGSVAGPGAIDGTVVMGDHPGGVSFHEDKTIARSADADTDKTQIFSRTMAMRGMSAEEYEEWQKSTGDDDLTDTMALETPAGMSASADSKRTQIWSKQSASGLDSSLIIRSRPVTGDADFESSLKGDRPDYEIVEKLAEGGMGAVYIAKQTSLNRELAIKTLKPLRDHEKRNYTKQGRMSQVVKQRREMFLSEALVTANLVHPHIIPIHDLCQTVDGSPFYSMKRVIGTPWNELITQMTQEENLEVLHKACDAIAYAHHNGVVNRDLKPENIMLGEFGEVLVLDWGLAVPSSTIDNKNFTSASASFGAGTPAYMSPELWTGPADAIGTWSDVYLMGAILFEAITGKPPHEFPEPDSKAGNSGLWKIIDSVVRKNRIRDTDVTGELMDIAMKAMHIDPKKRHASVLEFQEAVKAFQTHEASRRLAERAAATLTEGTTSGQPGGYQTFQTAAALFEEAHTGWPENESARNGLRDTRLAYANLAHTKGDYDLGLQIAAQEEGEAFTQLTQKLTKSRRVRNGLKQATMAAAGIIVLIGAFAIVQYLKINQQNTEIIALYGDKEQLETDLQEGQKKVDEADAKVAAADQQVAAANAKLTEANTQVAAAEKDLADANAEVVLVKAEVEQAEEAAAIAKMDAAEAASKAAIAMQEAKKADEKAADAVAAAEKANADVAVAKTEIAEAKVEVAKLEVSKVRATVDLRNADIANLIRNSDYSSALRQVEQMLTALDNDPELGKLPQSERERRMSELKARRGQLLKRSRSTESPVQTQVISPSGKTVVWGDSEGNLSLWKLDSAADDLPAKPVAKLQLNAQVSTVKISDDEQLIVAAAKNALHLWTPGDDQHHTIDAHGADITTVVLADGFLLAADAGGAIRSWDLATRKERWSIRSSAGIRDLAVLPQSHMFIYAGSRGGESADVLAYQLPPDSAPTSRPERLGQLRLPRNRNNPPQRIAVSPDEKLLLISNSRNGELIILPVRPETEFVGRDKFPFKHAADLDASDADGWVIKEHKRPINDITFSADGQRVVTASDDRSIGIWELADSGNLQFAERLEGHGAKVNAAGFVDAAGSKVLSASADRFCRFWDVETYDNDRREIQDQFDISFLLGIQVSTDAVIPTNNPTIPHRKQYILTGHSEGIQDTEAATDEPEYRVFNADHNKQRGAFRSVVLTPGGERVVTGATDGTAVIWETSTGRPVTGMSTRSQGQSESGSFDEGHDFNVSRMQFLPPEGNVLLTTGFDGNLCLWNADLKNAGSGTQELRIPGLGIVNAVAVSNDGKLIVTSSASSDSMGNGLASVWNTNDLLSDSQHTPIAILQGYHRSEVSAVAVSPDGLRVATGARDGRVAIWSINGGELIAGSRIHIKNTIVSHLEWLSDTRLLSAGFDGRMMVVEAISDSKKKLNVTATYEHDNIPIERVAFSPDGTQFLTVSVRTDKSTKRTAYEMQLWHPESTVPVRDVKAAIVGGRSPSRIAAVNWSPDGRRVAAAVDGNLQVFDSKSWRIQNVLEAPGLGVADAVFAPGKSPDGAEVIATFDGTSAHLWNLNDRTHKADFRPLFAVQAMALSEDIDNPLLLTGDRAIQIFNANPSSESFGQTLFKISDPHAGIITSLKFCPDSSPQKFVSGGADGSSAVWQWDAKKGEASRIHQLSDRGAAVVSTAWSPDGNHVLLTTADGRVRILKADQPKHALCDFGVNESSPVKLATAAFSSDGRFFLVAGHILLSGESRGWVYQLKGDAEPQLHCTIHGHEAGGISSAAFLPDSPYLITGGRDGAAMIWNWQPGRAEEATLEAYEVYQLLVDQENFAHAAPINSLTVSNNGSIATASDDGTAIVWKNPFAAAR